jgi:hypothetical protein
MKQASRTHHAPVRSAEADDQSTLTQQRDQLRERLTAIRRDIGGGLDKNYEEQSIQLENLEVLQEIARVTEQELRAVELRLAELEPAD